MVDREVEVNSHGVNLEQECLDFFVGGKKTLAKPPVCWVSMLNC